MSTRRPAIGVVLAAGASVRMATPKALLRDRRGRTFLERLASTLTRGGCDAVLVVVGRHAAEIAAELPAGVMLVRNPRWERGQLSSARVGISQALTLGARRILIHPIDQPLIKPADVRAVLAALERSPCAVAAFRGTPGHPLGLTHAAAQRLVLNRRAASLRDAVAKSLPSPRLVAASEGTVRGANSPEELEALLQTRRISSRG